MGNSNSEQEPQLTFEERIEQAEIELLLLTGIPLEYITRKNVAFEHSQNETREEVHIRTFIIDDSRDTMDGEQKPTLVIVHGFAASFV